MERYAQRVARIAVYDFLLLADAVSEDGKWGVLKVVMAWTCTI